MAANKNYSKDVFINCPFDKAYLPIFHAICFSVHDAGFRARCALEETDTSKTRLGKIQRIISECKYSIHDLSRVESGPAKAPLPRFNMPFECGLFFGAIYFGDKDHKKKQMLVLDSEPYRYHATLSDIAGQDIGCHANSPLTAIAKVRRFLNAKEPNVMLPGETLMQRRFQAFMSDLPTITKKSGLTVTKIKQIDYWPDMTRAMVNWLKSTS